MSQGADQGQIKLLLNFLDQKIRLASKETSKSLNTLIIEALEKKFLHQQGKKRYRDLNHFSGCWEDDPEFDTRKAKKKLTLSQLF